MARKSFVQLATQLDVSFPDNISGAITPAVLRDYFNQIFEALRPSSAFITRIAPTVQVLGLTDDPLVFDSGFVSDVPDFSTTAGSGTISRLQQGSTRLIFNATIEGPVNRTGVITLYENGIVTNRRVSFTTTGAGNPVNVAGTIILTNNSLVDYQLRGRASNVGTNFTFSNMILYADVLPVNNY